MTNQHRKEGMFLNADSSQDQREPPKGKGMLPHRRKSWHRWAIALGVIFLLGAPGGSYSEDGVSFVSKRSFRGPSMSVAGSDAKDVKGFSPSTNSSIESSIYGKRYSRTILRGVKLSDVFTFNDTETTSFGPAYANVFTNPLNFLSCMPPTGREFSYALCYYSGPDDPTGNNPKNPSLPCHLDPNGVVANCLCYEISTKLVSPKIPYYVDINAISNLDIYQETVETCGEGGGKCARPFDRDPDVCDAINANLLVPGAELISVFSPLHRLSYFTKGADNSTNCVDGNGDAGIYTGCMTAPCFFTGETDANGQNIVECKCPVFDGPYQIGQGNQNCDANEPPTSVTTSHSEKGKIQNNNVWSAAFNPGGGAIDIPSDACVPDLPPGLAGDKSCGLFDPDKDYEAIIKPSPSGKLCTDVCAAYGESVTVPGLMQVAYSCDAALCTTVGIGQEDNAAFPPPFPDQIPLLEEACSGITDITGMDQILLVEALGECSCCASQVCECDNINQPTNEAIFDLNQQQRDVGIEPQCDINLTLCGED